MWGGTGAGRGGTSLRIDGGLMGWFWRLRGCRAKSTALHWYAGKPLKQRNLQCGWARLCCGRHCAFRGNLAEKGWFPLTRVFGLV